MISLPVVDTIYPLRHKVTTMRALSLFFENQWEERKTSKRASVTVHVAMVVAASSAGIGKRPKRETAMVSYNILIVTLNNNSALFWI